MSHVEIDRNEGCAILTLVNKGKRNAIDVPLAQALVRACEEIEADPSIGAVVLRGAEGTFCSGGDRADLAAASDAPLSDENFERISILYESFVRFGEIGVPTVAAVRGAAVGAGLNLALAADVRIVSHDARLIPGFTRLGFHPGGGHLHLLHRAGGADVAAAVGMMGAELDGRTAERKGVAWRSLEDDEVEGAAAHLLADMAADPALARKLKASYLAETRSTGLDWRTALQVERVPQMWSFARAGERTRS